MSAETKELTALQGFRATVQDLGPQFLAALPKHVNVDKFKRAVVTAVTLAPKLLEADKRSLLAACMKCAHDGLMPDGRDAALVPFKGEVQYLPMIGGILKRMRQSGEVKSITVLCVYEGDDFRYWIDDSGEHLLHSPRFLTDDGAKVTHAYAIVETHESGRYVEVMTRGQIEKVQKVSRASSGPWVDWWAEMARKTVLRRLAKRAPMSTDLYDFLSQDDSAVDLSQASEPAKATVQPIRPTGIGHLVEHDAPAVVPEPAPKTSAEDEGSI